MLGDVWLTHSSLGKRASQLVLPGSETLDLWPWRNPTPFPPLYIWVVQIFQCVVLGPTGRHHSLNSKTSAREGGRSISLLFNPLHGHVQSIEGFFSLSQRRGLSWGQAPLIGAASLEPQTFLDPHCPSPGFTSGVLFISLRCPLLLHLLLFFLVLLFYPPFVCINKGMANECNHPASVLFYFSSPSVVSQVFFKWGGDSH